jgi:hypothetical protein
MHSYTPSTPHVPRAEQTLHALVSPPDTTAALGNWALAEPGRRVRHSGHCAAEARPFGAKAFGRVRGDDKTNFDIDHALKDRIKAGRDRWPMGL